jgi:CRISPR-associated protein Cas1
MDLLIDTFGTKIGSAGERIVLTFPNVKNKKEYPIRRVSKILILRAGSLSTNAVQLALKHDVDIVYLGAFGKPIGRIFSAEPKGIATIRKGQIETSASDRSFDIARAFVKGKCENQVAYIRHMGFRYGSDFSDEILQCKRMLAEIDLLPAVEASKEKMFGMEGRIADQYFSCLRRLSKFPGRITQGRDKYNSMINYASGILYSEVERACLYIGLDPNIGLYHKERYGKPSLVCDLVEEFRVPVADAAVFPFFMDKEIGKPGYFDKVGTGWRLSAKGRKLVATAVMAQLNQQVVWEGKRYTMKQVIENQTQALARYFTGRESEYSAFDAGQNPQNAADLFKYNE